ncbi:MAG: type IV secretory system conjugative DNA transfer family protein, partial [Trebonia sp.]
MSVGPLVWYRLRWPREVGADQLHQVFRLLANAAGLPVVLEAVGTTDRVVHLLGVPRGHSGGVAAGLRAILPGVALEATEHEPLTVGRSVELHLSTARRALRGDDPNGISRAALSALAQVGKDERLVLQWVLSRHRVAVSVPNRTTLPRAESLLGELASAPFGAQPLDPEARAALRAKQSEPGWRGVGRIGVAAASRTRQHQLIRQLLGALRTAEAPGVGFRVGSTSPRRLASAKVSWLARLRVNAIELAALSAWPVGPTGDLPVARVASRPLPPAAAIPRRDRVLGTATFPGRERPLALGPRDALRHLHLIGPTGAGKSTLLARLIAGDIAAGRGVVVIEPKGDLIADVLARIPPERVGDVVVLDPTDTSRPVGLNPLSGGGRSPELVADQLL